MDAHAEANRQAAERERVPCLRTDGVNTNGGRCKSNEFRLIGGKRCALALLGRQKQVNGSTQKVPLSKNIKLAVTPLVLSPFVPFRGLARRLPDGVGTSGVVAGAPRISMVNFHRKMLAKRGKILQPARNMGNISSLSEYAQSPY